MKNQLLSYLIIIFLIPFSLLSQGWIPLTQQSGKTYHKIVIQKGITLTGIKSKFSITEDQLKKANPNLTPNLAIGQIVLVPAKKETFIHTVVKGETMFAICQLYQINIDSLKSSNKSLLNSDIKIGQTLTIRNGIKRYLEFQPTITTQPVSTQSTPEKPYFNSKIVDVFDSSFVYTVKKGENISMISQKFLVSAAALIRINNLKQLNLVEGTKLKIPVNFYEKTNKSNLEFKQINGVQERFYQNGYRSVPSPCVAKDSLRITMIIPMNFKTLKHPIKGNHQRALFDFYNGVKMARDSLVKIGLKGDIYFHDCLTKGEEVSNLISKNKLNKSDIIILPSRIAALDTLIRFSEEKHIPLFCFFKLQDNEKYKSPYLYIIPTMSNISSQHMGFYLGNKPEIKEVVLITSGKNEDKLKEDDFSKSFESYKEGALTKISVENISSYQTNGKTTYFVNFSTDTNIVLPLISKINQIPNSILIGTREWTDMDQLMKPEKNPAKFYFWSTTCFDGETPILKEYKKNFKTANRYDLNKSVALGFDAMYLLSSWFFNLGNDYNRDAIIANIDFIRKGDDIVLNQALLLCRFSNGLNTRNVQFK